MKLNDPHPDACAHCSKGPLSKLISQSSFALKGSGWFNTLYSKTPEKKESKKGNAEKSDASKEKSTPESKTAPTVS